MVDDCDLLSMIIHLTVDFLVGSRLKTSECPSPAMNTSHVGPSLGTIATGCRRLTSNQNFAVIVQFGAHQFSFPFEVASSNQAFFFGTSIHFPPTKKSNFHFTIIGNTHTHTHTKKNLINSTNNERRKRKQTTKAFRDR